MVTAKILRVPTVPYSTAAWPCAARAATAPATAAIGDRDWLRTNRATILATRARLTRALTDLGFQVQESQTNFVWCTHPTRPHRPIYEALKAKRILVRFMHYAGWGDGLRITVGTDAEIDAFLTALAGILAQS